jgi:hypothetical protein
MVEYGGLPIGIVAYAMAVLKRQRNTIKTTGVMLHILLLSTFYPPKIDVALKITIESKFNNDLS